MGGGAAALSGCGYTVIPGPYRFMVTGRAATHLQVMSKGFHVRPYQVVEAAPMAPIAS